MAETLELQQVICPSCKQVITSFNPFQAQVECPYCHNKAFNPLVTSRDIPVPERIIVFKTTESDFERNLVDNLVERDYVPRNVFECISTDNVIKAYLPMYLYEGRYESSWTCKVAIEVNEVRASGGKVQNKSVKKFTPHTGTSQGNFAFLCLAYEGEDIPEELRTFSSQFPYNLTASKEYDPALLGIDSEKSLLTLAINADTDLIWNKYGDGLVNRLASENALEQLSGDEIKDFRASNSYDLRHNGRYVMAPFWFVYYTYNNQKHYFIMDGVGENISMSTPVDAEEVAFVEGKEKIKKIVTWLWPLAFVVMYFAGFSAGLVTLGLWLIGKIVAGKMMDKQIQDRLNESRAARKKAAERLK